MTTARQSGQQSVAHRPLCPGCGREQFVPEQSSFLAAGCIRHGWLCEHCGNAFNTHIDTNEEDGGHGLQECKNVNETDHQLRAREEGLRAARRSPAKLWGAFGIAIAAGASIWLAYSYHQSDAAVAPAALPQVVVSKPLVHEVDSRLGFLGQFSAVEQV